MAGGDGVLGSDRSVSRRRGPGTTPIVRIWAWLRAASPTATMTAPGIALFTVLLFVPILMVIYYSLTDWGSYGSAARFVGLANYRRLFTDAATLRALAVTGVLSFICTVLVNVIAVGLAMLLNHRGQIFAVYRAAIFYPFVISPVVTGFLWSAILNPQGAAEYILQALGLGTAPFLTNGNWAVGSLAAATIWNTVGFSVVLYLAGLQTIPSELLESGEVDGASAWQRFRHIVWPLLSSTVTINLVLILVGLLRTYDMVLSLTHGGPAGKTETIAYQILAVGYANGQLGYACAGAVMLLIATTVLAAAVIVYRWRTDMNRT